MCSLLTSYDRPGVRHLTPIKMVPVQFPAFAQLPRPLQINKRWVWKLYMLPRTLNLDAVFE